MFLPSALEKDGHSGGRGGDKASDKNDPISADEWRRLTLDYRCEWPMHLLVDMDALERFVADCRH